ncbi:HTH-type transcriptional repressor AllR [Achromobacter veterisilvae]|uniref:HTH-type transcriptional repressor AllR n=1 Tax=Achromobacter veterisilvae TaxID=2069367 RepID=A0A446CBN1_9BURK|nr:IclR family transcriptional regulator [Achromobacter veterisilvae]SSW65265.1 HTH-type transcriptional repressor AllR [Achromobacter veterisilvae]
MSEASPQASAAGPRVRPVPAVTRSIAILRLLGRSGAPMTLKEISQELDMVTSTCLHILRVLVLEGLVKVDAGAKRYSLGVGMLMLARSVIESSPFPALVQPVLDRLSSAANVTAIGVEVVGSEHMVVLALSRSTSPFSLHVDVGSRFPAFISATGRLVAAFSGFSDKELERRFKALRWDKAPEFSAWKADVEAARCDGYSMDRSNYINGVVLIAVPLLDSHDRMTHALVTAGLAQQLDEARAHALAQDLQTEARALSQLLAARS